MTSRIPHTSRDHHDSSSYTATPRVYSNVSHDHTTSYIVTPLSPSRGGVSREMKHEHGERYPYNYQNKTEAESANAYHYDEDHRSIPRHPSTKSSMNAYSARYHRRQTSVDHVANNSRSPKRQPPYFPQFENESQQQGRHYSKLMRGTDIHHDRQPNVEEYYERDRRYKEGHSALQNRIYPMSATTVNRREEKLLPRRATIEHTQDKFVQHDHSRDPEVEIEQKQMPQVSDSQKDTGEMDPRAQFFAPPRNSTSFKRQSASNTKMNQETAPLQKGQSAEEKKGTETKEMYADALLLAEMAQIARGEINKSSSTDSGKHDESCTNDLKTDAKQSLVQEEPVHKAPLTYPKTQVYHHDRVENLQSKLYANKSFGMSSSEQIDRHHSSTSTTHSQKEQQNYNYMDGPSGDKYEVRYRISRDGEQRRRVAENYDVSHQRFHRAQQSRYDSRNYQYQHKDETRSMYSTGRESLPQRTDTTAHGKAHYQQHRQIASVVSGSSCDSSSVPTADRSNYPSQRFYREKSSWEDSRETNRPDHPSASHKDAQGGGDVNRYEGTHQDRNNYSYRIYQNKSRRDHITPSHIRSASSVDKNKRSYDDMTACSRTPSYEGGYDDERYSARQKRSDSKDSQNHSNYYTRSNEAHSSPPRYDSSPNNRERNYYRRDTLSRIISEDNDIYHYDDLYKQAYPPHHHNSEYHYSPYNNNERYYSPQAAMQNHDDHSVYRYPAYKRDANVNAPKRSPQKLKRQFETPPTPGVDKCRTRQFETPPTCPTPNDDKHAPDECYSYPYQLSNKKITILRRKCAWKNYPELEAFLIENRDEYLRHSAMNYTVQQKQYNNRLTERLLDVAAKYGYVFDEADFNFVAVRDRIRCYYKSYVQSAKKRGIIAGHGSCKQTKLEKGENQDDSTEDEVSKILKDKTDCSENQESQVEREPTPNEEIIKQSIVIPDDASIGCETER